MSKEQLGVSTFEGRLDELIANRSSDVYRMRLINSAQYRAERSKLERLREVLRATLGKKSSDQLQELDEGYMTLTRMEEDAAYLQGLFDGIALMNLSRVEGKLLREFPFEFYVERYDGEDAAPSEVAPSVG